MHRYLFVACVLGLVGGAGACGSCAGEPTPEQLKQEQQQQTGQQNPSAVNTPPKNIRAPVLQQLMFDAGTDAPPNP